MKTNALKATAYQGRANFKAIDLLVAGELVSPNTLVRAMAVLESEPAGTVYCVDSQVNSDIVSLAENGTVLSFQPGLIPDIQLGFYWVYLTMFDAANPEGFAWGASPDRKSEFYDESAMYLQVVRWPVCDAQPEDDEFGP